jgi:hypothetical protein
MSKLYLSSIISFFFLIMFKLRHRLEYSRYCTITTSTQLQVEIFSIHE